MIVPTARKTPKGTSEPHFFLPVHVLSKVFRGKLLSMLEEMSSKGELQMTPEQIPTLLARAALKNWVVYSKPPVAGPNQVLDYLSRYTHRIAISNERLVRLEEGRGQLPLEGPSQRERAETHDA